MLIGIKGMMTSESLAGDPTLLSFQLVKRNFKKSEKELKKNLRLVMVVHTFYSSTSEAESGGSEFKAILVYR